MIRKLTAALLAASFVTAGFVGTAEAKSLVKLATLAPKESPWGKVFQKWKETVEKRTNGEVEVQWLWNGTAGPRRAWSARSRAARSPAQPSRP